MAAELRKVEIGFEGGQVVPVRLEDSSVQQLRDSLESEQRWLDVDTEDGTLALDLDRVAFLRIPASEHRVGF